MRLRLLFKITIIILVNIRLIKTFVLIFVQTIRNIIYYLCVCAWNAMYAEYKSTERGIIPCFSDCVRKVAFQSPTRALSLHTIPSFCFRDVSSPSAFPRGKTLVVFLGCSRAQAHSPRQRDVIFQMHKICWRRAVMKFYGNLFLPCISGRLFVEK